MDAKDFIAAFSKTGTIKGTARELKCSQYRARKILSSEGIIINETHEKILKLAAGGMNVKEIAEKLSLNKKIVESYLPAVKPYYRINQSENAKRIQKCRERKRKVCGMMEHMPADTQGE